MITCFPYLHFLIVIFFNSFPLPTLGWMQILLYIFKKVEAMLACGKLQKLTSGSSFPGFFDLDTRMFALLGTAFPFPLCDGNEPWLGITICCSTSHCLGQSDLLYQPSFLAWWCGWMGGTSDNSYHDSAQSVFSADYDSKPWCIIHDGFYRVGSMVGLVAHHC